MRLKDLLWGAGTLAIIGGGGFWTTQQIKKVDLEKVLSETPVVIRGEAVSDCKGGTEYLFRTEDTEMLYAINNPRGHLAMRNEPMEITALPTGIYIPEFELFGKKVGHKRVWERTAECPLGERNSQTVRAPILREIDVTYK